MNESHKTPDPPQSTDPDAGTESHSRQLKSGAFTNSSLPSNQRFGCPYYKRNPSRYSSISSCVYPGYSSIIRLKQHLYRRHARPILCPRCYRTFRSDEDLIDHVSAFEGCEPATPKPQLLDGFTRDQERTLRSRKWFSATFTDEDRWKALYHILFPDVGEEDIPSPYCDPITTPDGGKFGPVGWDELSLFKKFSQRELPSLVRNGLEGFLDKFSEESVEKGLGEQLKSQLGLQFPNPQISWEPLPALHPPRPVRNIHDANEAKAARKADIERRCEALSPQMQLDNVTFARSSYSLEAKSEQSHKSEYGFLDVPSTSTETGGPPQRFRISSPPPQADSHRNFKPEALPPQQGHDDYDYVMGGGGFAGSDPKKRRGHAAPPGRCHSCNRSQTSEWRRGPDGARTLCDSCGLYYAKLTRNMSGKAAAVVSSSDLLPKSSSLGSPSASPRFSSPASALDPTTYPSNPSSDKRISEEFEPVGKAKFTPNGELPRNMDSKTIPIAAAEPKHVCFELVFPDLSQHRARLPMRVNIFPHDTTDSIFTTVMNFFGLYGQKGVRFEDREGNTLIAGYENFAHNMVVYVRVANEEAEQGQHSPVAHGSLSPRPRLHEPFQTLPPFVNTSDDTGSVNTSSHGHSKKLASAELSIDNIVEGGRRKRAKFDSSELPLFVPGRLPPVARELLSSTTQNVGVRQANDKHLGVNHNNAPQHNNFETSMLADSNIFNDIIQTSQHDRPFMDYYTDDSHWKSPPHIAASSPSLPMPISMSDRSETYPEASSSASRSLNLANDDLKQDGMSALNKNETGSLIRIRSSSPNTGFHNLSSLESETQLLAPAVPSDSGYRSGVGTYTESVCSEGSIGSSLGLSQDFLQEFVAFFGDVLIERAGARNWAEHALAQHSPELIEKRLNGLLKDYSLELLETKDILVEDYLKNRTPARALATDVRIATGATKMIRRYRPKITRYFRDNVTSTPITAESIASRLQEMGRQLTVNEKLNFFERPAEVNSDPDEGVVDLPEDEDDADDGEEGDYAADLAPIRDFLVSGEPFQHLVIAMRRSFYCDDRFGMEQARQHVSAVLNGGSNLELAVIWSLPQFVQSQFDGRVSRLGSLVTITGSALYAQAVTCSEYLEATWPSSGRFFLDVLQNELDKWNVGNCAECLYKDKCHDQKLSIRILTADKFHKNSGSTKMIISAAGTEQRLLELTQQIAWIGAALSAPPSDGQLAYSEAVTTHDKNCLQISFRSTGLRSTENPCWLPLFCGASIARGFPIPERQDETGLEIPIDIMAGIAGVQHAVEYAGGIVMKGFSSMFVPIKRLGNLVQWHLISSPDCETRLNYKDVFERCKKRATLNEVSLDCLRTTRAIVGWCTAASITLGADSANYENIDYSGAKDAGSSIQFTGGTLGFQQFGVGQADFSLGPKDGKCHFQRDGPYRSIVSIADRTPVTLYDTAENRAWLVPASSVILHMVQHRNWLEPFEVDGHPVKLLSASPLGSSAKKALRENESTVLFGIYKFSDMVANIWSILEFLLAENVQIGREPGAALELPCQEVLKGYEFKAVVEERSPYRRKQTSIKKTCGGWPTLVRDIDALVLFANGFEDLIRPPEDRNVALCNSWRRVPQYEDYMATTVKTLIDLYQVAGCKLNRDYLTSTQLQWHRGHSSLFESCKKPGAYQCKCVRLQQILHKSAIGTIVPPGPLIEDGAVIFGHSSSVLQRFRPVEKAPTAQGMYSLPNKHLSPLVIDQDLDDTLSETSASENNEQTGSDATDVTAPSSKISCANEDEADAQDVSMTGLELGPCRSRKRPCPVDGSVDKLLTPSEHCVFAEPNKRSRNGENSSLTNFHGRESQAAPSPLTPNQPKTKCSPFDYKDEYLSNPQRQHRILKRQADQRFSGHSSSGEP